MLDFGIIAQAAILCMMPLGGTNAASIDRSDLEHIAKVYAKNYWTFHPFEAVDAGLHEFDGALPDRSPRAIDEWIRLNKNAQAHLRVIEESTLDVSDRVDLWILRYKIGDQLLNFETLKVHRREPATYDIGWGLLHLIRRDFAPLRVRIQSATELLSAAPKLLEQGRANLDKILPKVFCQMAIETLEGSATFIREDLSEAFASVQDDVAQEEFKKGADRAVRAIESFVEALKQQWQPVADDRFAIGESAFLQLLQDTEGVDLSIERLRALGESDLQRNLARAAVIAHEHFDGQSVADVMDLMKHQTYTASSLIPSIREEMDELRRFCLEHELVTIPSPTGPIVGETPKFARWATAMMNAPGAFESKSTQAYYDVTPVDPNWPAKEQEEWLSNFNRHVATNTSVHEAYPGHFVENLHTNRAPSVIQKSFKSYAAVEGWAHYVEQMMIEEGFRSDVPLYEIAQIQDALLRDCRFLCSIGMHTRGMTVQEATAFFVKNAFLEEMPARREAERGTFDPGYFKYTLGKLQILKLREDYRRKLGEEFKLKAFHDELLRFGMPPLVVTRQRMLDNGGSSL